MPGMGTFEPRRPAPDIENGAATPLNYMKGGAFKLNKWRRFHSNNFRRLNNYQDF
jgi:hypothetical protein